MKKKNSPKPKKSKAISVPPPKGLEYYFKPRSASFLLLEQYPSQPKVQIEFGDTVKSITGTEKYLVTKVYKKSKKKAKLTLVDAMSLEEGSKKTLKGIEDFYLVLLEKAPTK